MRSVLSAILLLLVSFSNCRAQNDMIIMRNGMSFNGKVTLVNKDKTIIKTKKSGQQELSNLEIYMIKYDKRGNVFFTDKGERITDNENNGKVPKGASTIYLVDGKEIFADYISILVDSVLYTPTKKKDLFSISLVSKSKASKMSLPKERVFLICHPDGTKDIITDFETLKKLRQKELERKRAREEKRREEAWLRSFPKAATIITKKNIVIMATVLSDDRTKITYKKENLDKSPIFTMEKSNIQDLFYKDRQRYSAR